MEDEMKPRFINLLLLDGNEVDIRTLPKEHKEEISIKLNRVAMRAIGYVEKKEK